MYNKSKKPNSYETVFTRFFKYCENNNVQLLDGDKIFIQDTVNAISQDQNEKRAILFEYFKQFQNQLERTKCEIKKQNNGRRAANLYLLRLLNS